MLSEGHSGPPGLADFSDRLNSIISGATEITVLTTAGSTWTVKNSDFTFNNGLLVLKTQGQTVLIPFHAIASVTM